MIGRCNDAMRTAFAYMAYCFVRTMYKVWPTTSWMTMPYFQMQEKFEQGCRCDVLGNWRGKLSELDPESKISRDVTDEEILEIARTRAEPDDPDGAYMLRRFQTRFYHDSFEDRLRWATRGIRSIPKPTSREDTQRRRCTLAAYAC